MSTENIFEYATRNKMRFPYRGSISIEDLWDLPLTGLDTVYKTLNKQVKQSQEESLLNVKTKEDETLDIQIAIVKYIVSVKLAEKAARKKQQRIELRGRKLCLLWRQEIKRHWKMLLMKSCRKCLTILVSN